MRIPRSTAIHEAGHAIADCRYGYGFHTVHAAAKTSVFNTRKGQEIEAAGACESVENFDAVDRWPHISNAPASRTEQYRMQAFRRLVVSFAGSAAEARQSKTAFVAALLIHGCDDLEGVKRVAKFVAADEEDERNLRRAAEQEARLFVRDPAMWAAINALADLLQARGKVERYEPDVIAITEGIERIPWMGGSR